jgi:hypothetical protein
MPRARGDGCAVQCGADGRDPAFGKGSRAYNRYQGDALHGPNPCIAPIEDGPFYAIKMVIGDLGTYAGIRTDANARALDADGQPIAGLYAAGNDMASIMGGNYPGAGITLGPALTFGYIAGRHIASERCLQARVEGARPRRADRTRVGERRAAIGEIGHGVRYRRTFRRSHSGCRRYCPRGA